MKFDKYCFDFLIFREFTGSQFILRNYTDIRWDRRITVRADELRHDRNVDQAYNVSLTLRFG